MKLPLTVLLLLPLLSLTAEDVVLESPEVGLEEVADNSTLLNFDQTVPRRKKDMPTPKTEEMVIRSTPVITPSVAPQVVSGPDAFISVDFIWWKTFVSGMEYAYKGVSDDDFAVPIGTSTGKGVAVYPDFTFKPGVKVGLGCHLGHDGWDMVADWTFLSGGNRDNSIGVSAGSGKGLTAVQSITLSDGTVTTIDVSEATSKWKQDFNVIDLELGRDFFFSKYLTMRPSIGFKTAWIHETTTNVFTPIPGTLDLDVELDQVALKNSEHMWGIGIRSAFDAGWHFTKNWMFYGDLAFTNLWGKFTKESREINTRVFGSSTTTVNTKENTSTVIPVVELGLGVSYINWFGKNGYRFEMRLGWEEQVWVNYNRSQDYFRTGDLTVQGLTLKTMLNF